MTQACMRVNNIDISFYSNTSRRTRSFQILLRLVGAIIQRQEIVLHDMRITVVRKQNNHVPGPFSGGGNYEKGLYSDIRRKEKVAKYNSSHRGLGVA